MKESIRNNIHSHTTPFQRLRTILKEERKDIAVILIYTFLSSSLSLIIPLTANAIVNTIAAGVFLQPLIVLTIILFVVLLFVGAFKVFQFYLVEILQQRVFAKIALNLCVKVPLISHKAWMKEYLPEVLNKFFDVQKVQKNLAKIIIDAPTSVLQIIIGLTLMAIYSPVLFIFDLLILLFIPFVTVVLGRNGVKTSINESSQMYRVAGWLQELARCQKSFKVDGCSEYFYNKTDKRVLGYLKERRKHFKILFRQAIANYFFYAIATAGIFGIGGWLVIEKQLTLGQLVASELIILILLTALQNLINLFSDWYELLTALDKIGQITDLETERAKGRNLLNYSDGFEVICKNVSFSYNDNNTILKNLNFSITSGEFISLAGASGAGKTTLALMLCGLLEPQGGNIELNSLDIRDIDLKSLRKSVAFVSGSNELFEGTVEENILVGRENISPQDVSWALKVTQLYEQVWELPDGIKTKLVSSGTSLSRGQKQKLLIARAIADKPKLLILDEAFTGIDARNKILILESLLLDPHNKCTVLNISHDSELVMRSDRVMVLHEREIKEYGSPLELIVAKDSHFSLLFPGLASNFERMTK